MDLEPWDPLEHPARIEVRRQESDDSDAEGGLGNVTRIVLRPPGHSGKAKRGHLSFDASYETGNLGRVDFISEFEYDLFIRPDTCNPRYRLWFNFVIDNVRTDQRVVLNMVNLCKVKTLFRSGMTPLVRSSSRPKWQRLSQKYVYYHKSPEHRNHYILSFAFAFDKEEDVYQFAFSYPYSYSRLQAHLDLVDQKELPYFRRETIAMSLQNRKVEVLTISNKGTTAGGSVSKRPKVVVVLARAHPGESPTSFVAQGLIDFMISAHAMVESLREHVIIKILPMINPDGVFLGNYRCSLMGYDLNRHWNQVAELSQPTLNAVRNYLLDLDSSKALDLDLVIDMHAHSSLSGAFIYGNSYDDVYRFERHILFPKLLAHNAEDFSVANTMYNRDSHKIGTARRHLCEILRPAVNTYTVEVSFHGYTQQSTGQLVNYNEDGYYRFGRNLARTLFEYYRVTGIINIPVAPAAPPEPEKKPQRRKSRSRSRSQPRKTPKGKQLKRGNSGQDSSNQQTSTLKKDSSREGDAAGDQKTLAWKDTENVDKGTEKTVVKLSQLTKARRDSSESSEGDTLSNYSSSRKRSFSILNQEKAARGMSSTLGPPAAKSVQSETDEDDEDPARRNVRVKRKSVETRNNQARARTATYKTFDFSTIDPNGTKNYRAKHLRIFRSSNLYNPEVARGRKIGGGGIIGHSKELSCKSRRRRHHDNDKGWHSEPETNDKCLTIIDFNLLIHKSLASATSIRRPHRHLRANYQKSTTIQPLSHQSQLTSNAEPRTRFSYHNDCAANYYAENGPRIQGTPIIASSPAPRRKDRPKRNELKNQVSYLRGGTVSDWERRESDFEATTDSDYA